MEIYFIRHGETDLNKKQICQGQLNGVKLNKTGVRQSILTAKYLKNFRLESGTFNCIYSSCLDRAIETAEIIAKELNYCPNKIICEDKLNEKDSGIFNGKKKVKKHKIYNKYSEELKKECNYDPILITNYKYKIDHKLFYKYKVETNNQLNLRAKKFIKELEESNFKKVIIVAHGKIITSILNIIFNINHPLRDPNENSNCFICYVTYNKGIYKMITPPNVDHLLKK